MSCSARAPRAGGPSSPRRCAKSPRQAPKSPKTSTRPSTVSVSTGWWISRATPGSSHSTPVTSALKSGARRSPPGEPRRRTGPTRADGSRACRPGVSGLPKPCCMRVVRAVRLQAARGSLPDGGGGMGRRVPLSARRRLREGGAPPPGKSAHRFRGGRGFPARAMPTRSAGCTELGKWRRLSVHTRSPAAAARAWR